MRQAAYISYTGPAYTVEAIEITRTLQRRQNRPQCRLSETTENFDVRVIYGMVTRHDFAGVVRISS